MVTGNIASGERNYAAFYLLALGTLASSLNLHVRMVFYIEQKIAHWRIYTSLCKLAQRLCTLVIILPNFEIGVVLQ